MKIQFQWVCQCRSNLFQYNRIFSWTVATFLLIGLLAVAFQFKSEQKAANATVQDDLAYAFNGEVQVSLLDDEEMEQIEGKGAPLIAVIVVQGGRMVIQRWVSSRVAASIVRAGGDVWVATG